MHYSWLSGFSLPRVTAEQIGGWWQFSGSTQHSWTPGQGWHFCLQFIYWLRLGLQQQQSLWAMDSICNPILEFSHRVMLDVIKAKNSAMEINYKCAMNNCILSGSDSWSASRLCLRTGNVFTTLKFLTLRHTNTRTK